MGQYYKICNLDKKQYLRPWSFGDGAKLLEFGCSGEGAMAALAILLACGNGRGGGDLDNKTIEGDVDFEPNQDEYIESEFKGLEDKQTRIIVNKIVGSWAGDKIVVAGDYADPEKWLTKPQIKRCKKKLIEVHLEYLREKVKESKMNEKEFENEMQSYKPKPILYDYAEHFFENISERVIIAMGADRYLKKDLVDRTWYMGDDDIPRPIKEWRKELKFNRKDYEQERDTRHNPTVVMENNKLFFKIKRLMDKVKWDKVATKEIDLPFSVMRPDTLLTMGDGDNANHSSTKKSKYPGVERTFE